MLSKLSDSAVSIAELLGNELTTVKLLELAMLKTTIKQNKR